MSQNAFQMFFTAVPREFEKSVGVSALTLPHGRGEKEKHKNSNAR